MTAVSQDAQKPLKERECPGMVDLTLDPRHPLHRSGDVGLAAQPRQQPIGRGMVTVVASGTIGAKYCPERRSCADDVAQALLHQHVGGCEQTSAVVLIDDAACEDILLENVEPSVDDRPERPRVSVADR